MIEKIEENKTAIDEMKQPEETDMVSFSDVDDAKEMETMDKMKNIYVPRRWEPNSDEEEDMVEISQYTDTPFWHRHFEQDELLRRYEPILEMGMISFYYYH